MYGNNNSVFGSGAHVITSKVVVTVMMLLLTLQSSGRRRHKKPQEPEYNSVVFSLDGNVALIPLDRQQGSVQSKVKALGFGGVNGSTVFTGERSSMRFKNGQKLQFVIRVSDQGTDPSTLVNLMALNSSKGKRELVTLKVGAMGLHADASGGKSASSVAVRKTWRPFVSFFSFRRLTSRRVRHLGGGVARRFPLRN